MIFFLYGLCFFGLSTAGAVKNSLQQKETSYFQSLKEDSRDLVRGDIVLANLNAKKNHLNRKQPQYNQIQKKQLQHTQLYKNNPQKNQSKKRNLQLSKIGKQARATANKKNQQKTQLKSQLKNQNQNSKRGYQIASSDKSKLLQKIKLKSGDQVLSINQNPISNSSSFYKNLYSSIKKTKPFQIRLKRGTKKLSLGYQATPLGKGKYKLQSLSKNNFRKLASIQNATPSKKTTQKSSGSPVQNPSQNKNTPNKEASNKTSQKTKSLVPEKYKPYMQRAYISRSNSFVYSQPNFDAPKLQTLTIGKLVLISRKVFLPPHSFGSFYRIFLFREKKLIGYVSQAEVIPEFIKKNNSYRPNPNYKKAKLYKTKKQILKIEEIEDAIPKSKKAQIQKETQKRLLLQTKYKKYFGLSVGYSPYLNSGRTQAYEDLFLGFKFSAYSPKIHLDFNLDLYTSKGSVDALAGLSFIKSKVYSLFVMGGGAVEYNPFQSNYYLDQIDYGPVGAVSLLIPLNKKLLLKLETKADYKIREKLVSLKFLSGLQLAF